MNATIHIGPGTDIDLQDLLQSRLIIQGNSGAGKSGLARKIMEECFGKVPFVVWDIEGEYYTLKELSGNIVVIGGLHADVPISMPLAEKLPKFIIDNRLTVVVDLSDMIMSERVRFTKIFFETLMDLPLPYWTSYLFFLEECHKLAGEQDKQESSTAVKDLMQRGRKRGFAGIVLTQRIGMLSKSVSAECNNKFIGRTSQDNDMDRSGKELGFRKNADNLKLRELKRAHFYAFGPSMQPDYVHEVIVDKPKTTMVKAGMQIDFKPGKPTPELLTMLAKLNEPVEKVKSETSDVKEEDAGMIETLQDQLTETKKYVFELQNELEKTKHLLSNYVAVAAGRGSRLNDIRDFILNILDKEEIITNIEDLPDFEKQLLERNTITSTNNDHKKKLTTATFDITPKTWGNKGEQNGQPTKGELRVLTACAQFRNGLNRKALTVMTGYSRRTRDAYIFSLINKKYADKVGEKIEATAAGKKILGPNYQPLPTGRRLRDYWLTELPPGERNILISMLDRGGEKPMQITRDYITEKTGYARRTRDAYIYNMLAKEILKVTGKGIVQVNELLYD